MWHKAMVRSTVSDNYLKVCFKWWKFKAKMLHLIVPLDVCSAIILGAIYFHSNKLTCITK